MNYPFYPATNFTKGRNGTPRLIVIHTMETPQSEGRAKQVALWFAGKQAPQASAHFMVDDKMIIQSVLDTDTAWAVDDWGLNQVSISIEHAAYAAQNAGTWTDTYSEEELNNSAQVAAQMAKKYNIPITKLSATDINLNKAGFCGHVDITMAKKIAGGHTDPGDFFPWENYLKMVQIHFSKL